MASPQLYDRIGVGYAEARKPDPFIAAQVLDALGDTATVLNVGAGTGNYEPIDRALVAVEPYWNRPDRYLDPKVQAGMSILARLPEPERVAGTERLRTALASGAWKPRG